MNWKHRVKRGLLFSLLASVAANLIYWGLLYTKSLHGFALAALGPAINLVYFHLDPNCQTPLRCYLEDFAVNIGLYTFWIFVALVGINAFQQLGRKLRR
jgi:hypothetical protein